VIEVLNWFAANPILGVILAVITGSTIVGVFSAIFGH
jgi:hypothetical protein